MNRLLVERESRFTGVRIMAVDPIVETGQLRVSVLAKHCDFFMPDSTEADDQGWIRNVPGGLGEVMFRFVQAEKFEYAHTLLQEWRDSQRHDLEGGTDLEDQLIFLREPETHRGIGNMLHPGSMDTP